MYKAYLFDFDYTLVDSSPAIIHCFNYAFKKEGLPQPDENLIKKSIGMPLEDMVTKLYQEADAALIGRIKDNYIEEADRVATKMTRFFSDVEPVMGQLISKGYHTGIVSTKNRSRIQMALEANQLSEYFTLIIGGEDVSAHKPDPEGLLIALERLQLTKKEMVFVGDSLFDYYAAKNAGVKFKAVLNGETTELEFMENGCPQEDILKSLSALL